MSEKKTTSEALAELKKALATLGDECLREIDAHPGVWIGVNGFIMLITSLAYGIPEMAPAFFHGAMVATVVWLADAVARQRGRNP